MKTVEIWKQAKLLEVEYEHRLEEVQREYQTKLDKLLTDGNIKPDWRPFDKRKGFEQRGKRGKRQLILLTGTETTKEISTLHRVCKMTAYRARRRGYVWKTIIFLCLSIPVLAHADGTLDQIPTPPVATGYASDPRFPTVNYTVLFYDGPQKGGQYLGLVVANQTGHRFTFALPKSILDGKQHTIYAYRSAELIGSRPYPDTPPPPPPPPPAPGVEQLLMQSAQIICDLWQQSPTGSTNTFWAGNAACNDMSSATVLLKIYQDFNHMQVCPMRVSSYLAEIWLQPSVSPCVHP